MDTNPWYLDDGLPVQPPKTEEAIMPKVKSGKSDLTMTQFVWALVCVVGLGLLCGSFFAAFMLPFKLVEWYFG